MKCRESSETRFGEVSRRLEPCSRAKRTFKVSKKVCKTTFEVSIKNHVSFVSILFVTFVLLTEVNFVQGISRFFFSLTLVGF